MASSWRAAGRERRASVVTPKFAGKLQGGVGGAPPEPWLLRVAEAGDLDAVARQDAPMRAHRRSMFRRERPQSRPVIVAELRSHDTSIAIQKSARPPATGPPASRGSLMNS